MVVPFIAIEKTRMGTHFWEEAGQRGEGEVLRWQGIHWPSHAKYCPSLFAMDFRTWLSVFSVWVADNTLGSVGLIWQVLKAS
jgi:hypothetical protein